MVSDKTKVAVVGAGPAGLAALKELRGLGFDVTLFERRDNVGGIWSWTSDSTITAALKETRLCNSKLLVSMSDHLLPKDFPLFPAAPDMESYLRSYASHYDLYRNIEFSKTVTRLSKGNEESQWQLQFADTPDEPKQFDRVVWATGDFLDPRPIRFEGQEQFSGPIVHSQSVRDYAPFHGKNVMVLGIGNTAGDIAINLVDRANKIYLSHRRGAKIIKRSDAKGAPADALLTPTMCWLLWRIESYSPWLYGKIMDNAADENFKRNWGDNKPEWGFANSPSIKDGQFIVCNDELIPYVKEGKIASVPGIKRIIGPRSVEMSDGQIIEDVDCIITCTGYESDMELLSEALTFVEGPSGSAPLPNLYMGIFPPQHADSLALISNVHPLALPQIPNRKLAAMSVAQVWAGNSSLPSIPAMETWASQHNNWLTKRLEQSLISGRGHVLPIEWQTFVHSTAGTGIFDNIGWGPKAWKLWWTDPELYKALAHGPLTAYSLRLFETGKRPVWSGARQAVIDAYLEMEQLKKGCVAEQQS